MVSSRAGSQRSRTRVSVNKSRGRAIGELLRAASLLVVIALTGCATRTLKMPTPMSVPSPVGPTIEVGSVADERSTPVLGTVDMIPISSGPDLIPYVESDVVDSISKLGFTVRQVDRNSPPAGHKRVLVSLLSAELSSESS